MKVTYEDGPNYEVESKYFLLPQSNKIVHLLWREQTNFDRLSLRGPTGLAHRALKTLAGNNYSVITVSYPVLLSKDDHKLRVSYLVQCGIHPSEANLTYDFSHLEKLEKSSDKRRPKEQSDNQSGETKDKSSQDGESKSSQDSKKEPKGTSA